MKASGKTISRAPLRIAWPVRSKAFIVLRSRSKGTERACTTATRNRSMLPYRTREPRVSQTPPDERRLLANFLRKSSLASIDRGCLTVCDCQPTCLNRFSAPLLPNTLVATFRLSGGTQKQLRIGMPHTGNKTDVRSSDGALAEDVVVRRFSRISKSG